MKLLTPWLFDTLTINSNNTNSLGLIPFKLVKTVTEIIFYLYANLFRLPSLDKTAI